MLPVNMTKMTQYEVEAASISCNFRISFILALVSEQSIEKNDNVDKSKTRKYGALV